MRHIFVFSLLALVQFPALAKQYVAVPDVPWDSLVPYVRANIVLEVEGSSIAVYVCPAHTDRSVATPFDDTLSDFTRVLIIEEVLGDGAFDKAIEGLADAMRHQVPSPVLADRGVYREQLWDRIVGDVVVLPRLQLKFAQARETGKLRCRACEKDKTYAPAARRVGK